MRRPGSMFAGVFAGVVAIVAPAVGFAKSEGLPKLPGRAGECMAGDAVLADEGIDTAAVEA